jgi:hypothetical protein
MQILRLEVSRTADDFFGQLQEASPNLYCHWTFQSLEILQQELE